MKIVLDTNVLIAAFIAHGSCSELLEHCAVRHVIVLSQAILNELQDVLVRKFDFTHTEARLAGRLLKSRGQLVKPSPLPEPVCRDPDDDMILATAITGGCLAIITGDKDLTDLTEYKGVRILMPSEFWQFENEIVEQDL